MGMKNLLKIYIKMANHLSHHRIQKIKEENLLGFSYDDEFKNVIIDKYPNEIIKRMLNIGDLKLGLLLKRLDDKCFDLWLEQYSKTYSPLGYDKDYEQPLEALYGHIFDNLAAKIK